MKWERKGKEDENQADDLRREEGGKREKEAR